MPFRHVFVEPRGIKPCCSYSGTAPMSIDEWTHSDELKKIQHVILQGQVPMGCKHCIRGEQQSNHSTRLEAINDYGTDIVTDTVIDYVDFRSSNICNFRCRSCEPFYSNGIAQEIKKNVDLRDFLVLAKHLPPGTIIPKVKQATTDTQDYQWVIDHLPQIKRLMITGGEPTKISEVRNLVEHIRQNRISTVQVMLTSNASFTDPYWIELTREMPNIHWTLSLDAVGPAAEVIRDGTKWSVVSRNIETMFDIAPSVNIGTVITNLSVFQLKPLFRFVNDLEKKYSHRANGRTQFIQFCQWPEYMAPYILHSSMKDQALEYLGSFDFAQLQPSQIQAINNLSGMIASRKRPYNRRWQLSETYNNMLDEIRGQQHDWLFVPAH